MDLKELIYKRKSCRSYTSQPVEKALLEKLKSFPLAPLYPEIKVHWEFTPKEQVRSLCPWTTPQVISIYSEKKEGYLENVGFIFQQMDLYLQSLGLGACWLGLGKPRMQYLRQIDGMEFVIMLAFGYPEGDFLRQDLAEFKRKSLKEIADKEAPQLEPARLAPSSINSQPWYFTHEGDLFHLYCVRKGVLKPVLRQMNQIDIGIVLAHLYVENPDTFRFFKGQAAEVDGYEYMGSFSL